MAEARLAVDPHPAVSRVGYEVDTSVKTTQVHVSQAGLVVYIPHPRFLLRSFKHLIRRSLRRVQVAFLPIPTWMVFGIVSGMTANVVFAKPTSWVRSGWLAEWLWKIDSSNPLTRYVRNLAGGQLSTRVRVAYLALFATGVGMAGITMFQRFLLRQVLSYHGWINEGRGKMSLTTKLWAFILRYVYIRRIAKNLYAYQGCLPTLPLPEIEVTVKRYLKTMDPLLDDEEKARAAVLAKEFLANEGPQLQYYLWVKWLFSSNYISDWWVNLVYLRARDPLPINSNWYGVLAPYWQPTTSQACRVASLAYQLTKINYYIDNGTFEPQALNKMIPLCMQQYEMGFRVTRIPGLEQDVLVKTEADESRHLAVLHKGRFYKVACYSPHTNNPLTALQLYAAFEGILNSPDETDSKEAYLPALTAMNRSEWANIRMKYFIEDSYNRSRLELIEKALFVVCLDDYACDDLTAEGRNLLMGNGHNRWSDKSFNLVVLQDARGGVHGEHTWGDAPTLAHLIEICSCKEENMFYYNPDGSVKEMPDDTAKKQKGKWQVYPAERIHFRVSPELEETAEKAYLDYKQRIDEVDYHVLHFRQYGKGEVKKARMSPDGWLQMALQVAYYRDRGRFDQTYESSMTRLFYGGRTETIRSASTESAAFVKAMCDSQVSSKDKIALLKKATDQHQQYSHDAMTGKAIDRHLFGLFVVSRGKTIDSPFLNFAMGHKWKLSTSQVPTRQCSDKYHHPDMQRCLTPNGGFGPVADDGYGVSYTVMGEDDFFFNVSGKKGHGTDCKRFAQHIESVLLEMAALAQEVAKSK